MLGNFHSKLADFRTLSKTIQHCYIKAIKSTPGRRNMLGFLFVHRGEI